MAVAKGGSSIIDVFVLELKEEVVSLNWDKGDGVVSEFLDVVAENIQRIWQRSSCKRNIPVARSSHLD